MRALGASRTSLVPGGVLAGPWVRDDLWRRARAVPSLDLRFADNKSLTDAVTGASLVTFIRNSIGTYTNSAGVLRSAVTNLLLRSEEFDNASWSNTGLVAYGSGSVANTTATTAPNGTFTAEKIVEASGGTTHLTAQTVTIVNATVYTLSVYAQAAERSRVALYFGGAGGAAQGIIVNLSNGTFAANIVAAPTSYSIVSAGNGWYRISITATSTGTAANHSIYICNDSNAFSYSGDGTSGIYLWGAQLEQSATVGEYIPTTSAINSAPRFDHNPTTGESLGLLVEQSRTNLFERSEEFENAYWTKTRASVTNNSTSAPNGATTADKLVEDATASNTHQISRTISVTSGAAYTWSIYCKAAERSRIVMSFANQFPVNSFAEFNVSAGTIVSTGALGTGNVTIQPLINGWYRLIITGTASATATSTLVAYMSDGVSISYTGDGTSGIYLWGAQLE